MHGRIGRRDWWLGQIVYGVLLAYTMPFVATREVSQFGGMLEKNDIATSVVTLIVFVVCLWANLATSVKRYHDRGKSGLWVAILFVPTIGIIWHVIECGVLPGTAVENAYGPARGKPRSDTDEDRREAVLQAELAALKAQIKEEEKQAALANARYASDVKRILAADQA